MIRAGPLASRVVSPLQFLVLLQLNNGSKYGYEMLKLLRDEFEGVWDVKTGTFYPAIKTLEARGFVETELKGETEYYILMQKGKVLINTFGEHIEMGSRFTNRYLRAMVKLLPLDLKVKALESFRRLSEEDVDIYSTQLQMYEAMDKELKLELLDDLSLILKTRLDSLERLRREFEEG